MQRSPSSQRSPGQRPRLFRVRSPESRNSSRLISRQRPLQPRGLDSTLEEPRGPAEGLQVLEAPVRGLVCGRLPDLSEEAGLEEEVDVSPGPRVVKVAAVGDPRHPGGLPGQLEDVGGDLETGPRGHPVLGHASVTSWAHSRRSSPTRRSSPYLKLSVCSRARRRP